MKDSPTTVILEKIINSNNPHEIKELISGGPKLEKPLSFAEFFNNYLSSHQDIDLAQIIKNSNLSRTYAYEVINGKKKASRDRIIALCFAAKMNMTDCNHALIFSEQSPLYARNTRDASIIFFFKQNEKNNAVTVTELNEFLVNNGHTPLTISKEV